MNEDLLQLTKDYTTKEHAEINASLLGKSKDNLVAILIDLLTTYYNDSNSSTVRELVVAEVAGYEHIPKKLGYNGFRHNTLIGEVEHCEIKPPNVRSNSTKKLNGDGNFGDYSWARFQKHQEENPNMLVAGFVDGCLIYIFEFSFNEHSFTSRLRKRLEDALPNGDVSGRYQRNASFTFKHYKDAGSLKTIYTAPKQKFTEAQSHITKEVFQHLEKTAQ